MTSNYQTRLLGIDLCRGLAAYAVVLVHSGDEAWGIPISGAAIQFRLMFYFAVPYFLAAAFYFLTRKPTLDLSPQFWKSRIQRILIPYVIWSVIYIIVRSIFFLISHKTDRIAELFDDPLALLFFGAASYHLYFLPLLFAGTSLLLVIKHLSKRRISWQAWAVLALVSTAVSQLVEASGNGFQLGEGIAFGNLLEKLPDGIGYAVARIMLVEIAWIIRCAPYAFSALVIHRFLANLKISERQSKILTGLFLTLFVLTATLGKIWLPSALQSLLVAYFLLLAGVFGSSSLRESKLITSIGACSFGIYLIHPIPMNFVKALLSKGFPALTQQVSIASMLTFSISSFLLSWLLVAQLTRFRVAAKYLFGT